MKNESRQLYKEGKSLSEISKALNATMSQVKYYIYSVGPKPEIIEKEKLTEFQQNRIRQLLICKDYTIQEIADEVGAKPKDIQEFVKRG